MARIRMFEKSKTVRGDVSAPVIAYIGESGEGEDRCVELEGATLFDKMLALYDAGTYVSIGPAEGSDDWKDLDKEDQSDYRILQARAKKKTNYKQMGDFISSMCDANECFLFALRQGDDAVWVNPRARSELRDREWLGDDADWLEDACGVWENYENKKMEAIPPRDEWDKFTLESTGLIDPIKRYISHVVPAACTVTIYDEQSNQPTDDQMVDIKFKVRVAFDDNAAFVYDGECTQTYTGEGEFGMYAIPNLYLTPSKESDFPVDTSKVLKGWAGGSLAFSDLSKHINSTLAKIPYEELFKKSPKLGSIYIAKDMSRHIYPRMRDTAIAVLYPEEDTDYAEFDYDTAERILYSYFDDYMLQYTNAAKKIKKEVDNGKVFASLSDMKDYATDCFADEYSAEELKDIVIDGIENPSDD